LFLAEFEVKNTTENSSTTETTTYTYTTFFSGSNSTNNNSVLAQSFSVSTGIREVSTANVTLTIQPLSLKWAIIFNTSEPFPHGLNITYQLPVLSSMSQPTGRAFYSITSGEITTYYISFGNNVAQLEVFGIATMDGRDKAIEHSVVPISSSSGALLELQFPAFQSSLYYDPILSVGVLVGSQSGNSSNNTILIVAAVVGVIGGALLLTGLFVIVGVYLARSRMNPRTRTHIAFEY